MSSNISFSGLASGLNTTALVQNVLRFNQQRISLLQNSVTTQTTQQTSFQGIQTRLQTLETQAGQLGQSQGSVFDAKTVTSSNSSLVTAAAGTGAQTGTTSLKILSLAQASQVASQGYADANSTISQGTFQIQAGSKTATITIDSTNNTLSGLSQAINAAGVGVSATVVDTGTGDARTQPYRLILTSSQTGTANAIKITNNLAATGSGAVQPNFATNEVGPAVTSTSFSGTSSISSNSGPGGYTGSSNDTYTFTVVNGGTVGSTNGIQVAYTNSSGSQTGTLTINAADAGTSLDVVDGVKVQFGAGSLNNGDQFTLNTYAPTLQSATNAQVQLGSGAGAITVQSATNTLSNLIPGVTVSLQGADPSQTVQLNVNNDVSSVATQITNFVNDYNDFASYLATQTAYTPGTGTAAGTARPLNGNTAVVGLQNQVEQILITIAPNLPSQINRLSALGITPDANGQLQIDKTQLNNVLSGGVAGVGFNDVKNLFSLQGQSSSAGVQFATASSKTNTTSTNPYTVHITQAATRAGVTASTGLGASTVIDGSNNTLSLTVDGKSTGVVTLASGTYTQLGLANEVQSELNSSLAANGGSVSVSVVNNNLVITSNRYGAASTVSGLSGSAVSALGYTGSESSAGTDVAGSFVVNGVTEAATGVGQVLTGNSGNTNTDGLTVAVTLTPSQVTSGGADSTLSVTRGLAATLDNSLKSLLDPVTGQLTLIANQITKNIQSAQSDVTTQTNAMNAQQTALMAQFAALESVMSNLQSTSNLLTSLSNSSSGSSAANTSLPSFSSPTSSS